MPDPADISLRRLDPPTTPTGVVLMLHGGAEFSHDRVGARSLSWQRAAYLQRAITPQLHAAGVATWLLRFTERGWNTTGERPQADARAALNVVRREWPGLPVVLLGHSMGARTAVHVADDPAAVGVVALAPWLPEGEPVAALRGRHLVAGHGSRDTITSAEATRAYVERAASVATSAQMHDMGGVGHYLLRRTRAWNDLAVTSTLDLLR